jgi:hypothetical protein
LISSRSSTLGRRTLRLGGVALLGLALGAAPAAESAAARPERPARPAAPSQEDEGIEQVDESKSRLGIEAEGIMGPLEPLLGDDLGLTWIGDDEAGNAVLFVGVRGLGERDDDLAGYLTVADRGRVRFVDATYSMADLRRWQERMFEALDQTGRAYTIGIGIEGTGASAVPRLNVGAADVSVSTLRRWATERSVPAELVRLTSTEAPTLL